jgi:RHS repeat-associated protein
MLGSSRTIVQAGQTSPCYDADFYPFGGEKQYVGTCLQNYLFTGNERDSETNNDNLGVRHYSSIYGRFMSPDPLGNFVADPMTPQTWNMYSYVLNNPLRYIDPTGYAACYWDDGTHDPPPESGGEAQEQCNAKGGTWLPTWNQSVTVFANADYSSYSSDIWLTGQASQPQDSYAQCVKNGGNATSVQHFIQYASGGRLGKGLLSGALFGNPVSGTIQFAQDVGSHDWSQSFSGGAATGGGLAAGSAAQAGAKYVPNVTVAVAASVSIAASSSQGTVGAAASIQGVLPVGQLASGALSVGGKALATLGNVLVLPVSIAGSSFSAVVCSIGR